jgi:two-component system, OmpR family, copper resistance phosphate regulon response regulator CusR
MRILVVEDEKKVAKALRDGLEAHHYDVDVAATGEDGFFSWARRRTTCCSI